LKAGTGTIDMDTNPTKVVAEVIRQAVPTSCPLLKIAASLGLPRPSHRGYGNKYVNIAVQ
jgi:hypothetical protein